MAFAHTESAPSQGPAARRGGFKVKELVLDETGDNLAVGLNTQTPCADMQPRPMARADGAKAVAPGMSNGEEIASSTRAPIVFRRFMGVARIPCSMVAMASVPG